MEVHKIPRDHSTKKFQKSKILWLGPDRLFISQKKDPAKERSCDSLGFSDVQDVRIGDGFLVRTTKCKGVKAACCVSIVGSERSIDVHFQTSEVAVIFAERFNKIILSSGSLGSYDVASTGGFARNAVVKKLSMADIVVAKRAEELLKQGLELYTYDTRGTRAIQVLWLTDGENGPRICLSKTKRSDTAALPGIDVKDVSGFRAGIAAFNFPVRDKLVLPQDGFTTQEAVACSFSVIASETTFSLMCPSSATCNRLQEALQTFVRFMHYQ